jgi:hypothetical protein
MRTSWWDLGNGSGYRGRELALNEITCPFCKERGNFAVAHHSAKKKANSDKVLNFDTLKCGSCASFVMVLWSAAEWSSDLHDFLVLPWPLTLETHPKHWPAAAGRFWIQAHRNLRDENWDAVVVMARSALQAALREQKAEGATLKAEIDHLASKGLLPPIISEWSHNVRELGNESAHPKPEQAATERDDARDIVQFLDFLMEYLYDLPKRIKDYRDRPKKPAE